jgi:hypothetical protein
VPKRKTIEVLFGHFKSVWWLYVGLLFELLYGLTMATHHMMFSFRFFVPYIPATVIVVVALLRHATETRDLDLTAPRPANLFTGFLVCIALFQFYQYIYTYQHSVNGLSLVGEYRSLGIRDYVHFMQTLEQEAVDIEDHWSTMHAGENRQPRILTYAAGVLPYTYRDAYIYEKLVSYRHCYERQGQGKYADYIHMLAPRQGPVDQQLPGPDDKYSLISSYEMFFDGSMQKFLVYYNPSPEPHNLSNSINASCLQDEQATK